jgi:RHS repeat-associated protein
MFDRVSLAALTTLLFLSLNDSIAIAQDTVDATTPSRQSQPEPDLHGAGGEFTQFIPIEVPEFRGIEPKIGLAYNSSDKSRANADAILGVGWRLSGISKIEKVSLGGGVPFWDPGQDLFRLDGQELMACNGKWDQDYPLSYITGTPSASCSANGNFSTQVESFRRIEFIGENNAFWLTDPDGTVSIYRPIGAFTEADDNAVAGSDTFRLARRSKWLLAEVRDLSGNTVTYDYAIAQYAGFAERITSITYSNGYAVNFRYTDDPNADQIPSYATGTAKFGKQTRQLSAITVLDGTTSIRAYSMDYRYSVYTKARLLKRVIPYGNDYTINDNVITSGSELPDYVFDYTGDGYDVNRLNYPDLLVHSDYRIVDFDYNGIDEVAVLKSEFGLKSTATNEFISSTEAKGVTFWFNRYDRGNPRGFNGRVLKKNCDIDDEDDNPLGNNGSGGVVLPSLPGFQSCDGVATVDFLGNRRGDSPHSILVQKSVRAAPTTNGWRPTNSALFVGTYEETATPKVDRYRETGQYSTQGGGSSRVNKGLQANLDLDPDTEFFGMTPGDYAITSVVDGRFQDESWYGQDPVGTKMDIDGNGVDDFIVGGPRLQGLGGIPLLQLKDYRITRTRPSDGKYEGVWRHRGSANTISADAPDLDDYFTENSSFIGIWDMNGDGPQDFVYYEGNHNNPDAVYVQYGSGVGFTAPEKMPVRNPDGSLYTWVHLDKDSDQETDFEIADINGDGLADLLVKYLPSGLETRSTLCVDTVVPVTYAEQDCYPVRPQTVRDADIFLNTGAGFRKVNLRVDNQPLERVIGTGDFDGDGIKDLLLHSNGIRDNHGPASVYFGNGDVPNIMTNVTLPTGGELAVQYRGSPYDSDGSFSGKSEIPGVRQVVDRIVKKDGLGGSAGWVYDYTGAGYDFVRRKSLGYEKVIIRMPEGDNDYVRPRIELTYDNGHIGEARKLRERKVMQGADTVLEHDSYYYRRNWTAGDRGPFETLLSEVRTRTSFDGSMVMARKTYEWDPYGQPLHITDFGFVSGVGEEVTPVGDVTTLSFTYKRDLEKYIVTRASSETLRKGPYNSNLSEEQLLARILWSKAYQYDGGIENLTRGLLTQVREFVRPAGETGAGVWRVSASFGNDSYGNRRWEKDAKDAETIFEYGQKTYYLTKVTNALGHMTKTEWNLRCQKPETITDPNEVRSITFYDAHCREYRSVLKPEKPIGNVSDAYSIRTVVTDYINFGAPTLQRIVTKSNSASGKPFFSRTYLDGFGRTYMQASGFANGWEDGAGVSIESVVYTAYDSFGRVKWTSLPVEKDVLRTDIGIGRRTGFAYDLLGRIIRTENPDDTQTVTRYFRKPLVSGEYFYPSIATLNEDCFKATVRVPCLITAVSLDDKGQVVAFRSLERPAQGPVDNTTPVLASTFYNYDPAGRLIGVTDPEGAVWHYRYNSVGERTYSNDPGLGIWDLTYDVNHNLKKQTDAKFQEIGFTYDALNRVLTKTVTSPSGAGTVVTTFTYDGNAPLPGLSTAFHKGKLTTQSLPGHAMGFEYDAPGNIVSSQHRLGTDTYRFETTYATTGVPTAIKAPYLPGTSAPAPLATYTYGPMDRLATATGGTGNQNLITGVEYNRLGLPTQTTFGNGLIEKVSYDDKRFWMKQVALCPATGTVVCTPLLFNTYARAASGRIDSVQADRVEGNFAYTYDRMGRLVNAAGVLPQVFTYDRAGRMTSNSTIGTYAYGSAAPFHAPAAITNRPGGAANLALTYDLNGNMTTGFDGKLMTYDAENRPLSVMYQGKKTCYVYGADGGRLMKVEAETTALDCANPTATGGKITLYLGPLEIRDYKTPAEARLAYPLGNIRLTNGTPGWLHTDALGSVRGVSEAAGLVETSLYKPYGEQLEWGGASPQETKGWIGERFDADAGLQYLNARYYDPMLGIFLQPDWFEVMDAGTNRFGYSYNDPINLSDPGGNCPICVVVIAVALLGSSTDPANAPGPGDPTLPSNGDTNMLVTAANIGAARIVPVVASAVSTVNALVEGEEELAVTGVQANAAVGAAAEREVVNDLENQGLEVQPRVTLTNGETRCVADCVISGAPGQVVQVPDGYTVEDLSGKPVIGGNEGSARTITLNSNGQAIIEIKTGAATLTANQAAVYPSAPVGDAMGVGGNAARAGVSGRLGDTSVFVFRKD